LTCRKSEERTPMDERNGLALTAGIGIGIAIGAGLGAAFMARGDEDGRS
jgi:hypothetical protein